jgi:hypothetical protein
MSLEIPDLLQVQVDEFVGKIIRAALDEAEGDAEVAAGLLQSPKLFLGEARRLGILPATDIRVVPLPVPEREPHAETPHLRVSPELVRDGSEQQIRPAQPDPPVKRGPGRPPGSGRKSPVPDLQPPPLARPVDLTRGRRKSRPEPDERPKKNARPSTGGESETPSFWSDEESDTSTDDQEQLELT